MVIGIRWETTINGMTDIGLARSIRVHAGSGHTTMETGITTVIGTAIAAGTNTTITRIAAMTATMAVTTNGRGSALTEPRA